jgi:hypothetical protein
LAQESGIESSITLGGNHMPGHCQASDNITVGTRDDALAKTPCIDITHAPNIIRQCSASCGKFSLDFLEASENAADAAACSPSVSTLPGSDRVHADIARAELGGKHACHCIQRAIPRSIFYEGKGLAHVRQQE